MSNTWNRCTTTGCENERQSPAACCSTCLRTHYGYGEPSESESGRLVEPATSITHLPKMPQRNLGAGRAAHTYQGTAEEQLKLQVAALTERLIVLERTFESYKQTPLDTVPEEFKDLQPFTGSALLHPFASQLVEVKPYNAESGFPRYCVIRAHDVGSPNNTVHVQLGGVMIAQCPQMQFQDENCERYVSTKFFDLKYGVPVDWAAISQFQNRHATFYLKSTHAFNVKVNIELWCDTRITQGPELSYPFGGDSRFHRLCRSRRSR
jgi:hypothetical protein